MTTIRRTLQAVVIIGLFGVVGAMAFAWFAGWRLDVVESESMAPILHRNSVAIVVPVHGAIVERGDVIAFVDYSRGGREVIHRVVHVVDHGQGRFYETKGDANPTPDSWLVPASAVQARMELHVAHLGALTRALAPPRGLLVLVAFPLLLGALTELRVRMRIRGHRNCPTCGALRPTAPRPKWTQPRLATPRSLDPIQRHVLGWSSAASRD